MGSKSKEKGKRGERKAVEVAKAHGFMAKRNPQDTQTIKDNKRADVNIALNGKAFAAEVKLRKTLPIKFLLDAYAQAVDTNEARQGDMPIVVCRQDNGRWYVFLEYEHFLEAVK